MFESYVYKNEFMGSELRPVIYYTFAVILAFFSYDQLSVFFSMVNHCYAHILSEKVNEKCFNVKVNILNLLTVVIPFVCEIKLCFRICKLGHFFASLILTSILSDQFRFSFKKKLLLHTRSP